MNSIVPPYHDGEAAWRMEDVAPPIFRRVSADYGVKSSESIFLGGASTMEGRGVDPMTFQEKSSVFGVCPNNSWPGQLPICRI
jgi:hypothetical protein